MTVKGATQAGYEDAFEAFQRLVSTGKEVGAGLAVVKDGKIVLSASGGTTNGTDPWNDKTLVMGYSVSKPFAALAAMYAVAKGAFELDSPVARYWPGFGINGKDAVTVRQILTHTSGLSAFPVSVVDIDALDQEALLASLANAPLESTPGTVLAEHAATYGHLIDGLLRGATGDSLQDTWHRELQPQLAIDAWFGVPNQRLNDVADLQHGDPGGEEAFMTGLGDGYGRVLQRPTGLVDVSLLNSEQWRTSTFGAINMHASAVGLATFYDQLLRNDGIVHKLLGSKLHQEYTRTQVVDDDRVVGVRLGWTPGFLQTPHFIGLGGLGGSAAWWSHDGHHGVAYVTRQLLDHSRVAQVAGALGDNLVTAIDGDRHTLVQGPSARGKGVEI